MDPAYHEQTKTADEPAPVEVEADGAVEPIEPIEPVEPDAGSVQAEQPLPTMSDLDGVASELDQIDAKLAALDDQR